MGKAETDAQMVVAEDQTVKSDFRWKYEAIMDPRRRTGTREPGQPLE
jgi:hypothetical protein